MIAMQNLTAHNARSAQLNNNNSSTAVASSSMMETELKSLQSKIMDLENKLSFTHNSDTNHNVDEELLKSGIMLANDPFKSIDERKEFEKKLSTKQVNRKGSGSSTTDKSRKFALHNNFLKKGGIGHDSTETGTMVGRRG